MNAVTRFQTLPEAHAIPDEIWTLAKLEEHLEELIRQKILCERQVSLAALAARKVLQRDWKDAELLAAGLL